MGVTSQLESVIMLCILCTCVAGAFRRWHSGPDSVQWRSGRSGTAAGGLYSRRELLYVCGVCRAYTGLHTPCRWHSGKRGSDEQMYLMCFVQGLLASDVLKLRELKRIIPHRLYVTTLSCVRVSYIFTCVKCTKYILMHL